MFTGPILDRGPHDPDWVSQPCVLKEDHRWRMWYVSCQKVEQIHGRPEPFRLIKYAESEDGIYWHRTEQICIDFSERVDAIGRPCIWKEDGRYIMLHSDRRAQGYRDNPENSYRIRASQSDDGVEWKSIEVSGLERSETGWDSVMNEYCATYLHDGQGHLLYNGNGFGASGFGYGVLARDST